MNTSIFYLIESSKLSKIIKSRNLTNEMETEIQICLKYVEIIPEVLVNRGEPGFRAFGLVLAGYIGEAENWPNSGTIQAL